MLRRAGFLTAFKALDVGFNLLGHLQQNRGGAAIEDRLGEAAALLGAGAHPFNHLAIFVSHNDGNSPKLRPFLHSARRAPFPFRLCLRGHWKNPSPFGTARNGALPAWGVRETFR